MYKIILILTISISFSSCKQNIIKNHPSSNVEFIYRLEKKLEKNFALDSITAQKPKYVQLINFDGDKLILSFLNDFTNSIYLYDYHSTKFFEKRLINKNTSLVQSLGGYYFNKDRSIYLFDEATSNLILVDSTNSIIKQVYIPTSNYRSEYIKYPVYSLSTLNPIIKTQKNLLITGLYPWKIPDSLISKFGLTNKIDIDFIRNDTILFQYPKELYGNGFYWDDPYFNSPYTAFNSKKNLLVFSFPVSHDIYISSKISNGIFTKKAYGGSREAKDITAMDRKTSLKRETMRNYIQKTDVYGGIIYDKYNDVYYRFIERHIEKETENVQLGIKPLGVIILNSEFKIVGESTLGPSENFHWRNAFVTEEGLNIEKIDKTDLSEEYLKFQIFDLKQLN